MTAQPPVRLYNPNTAPFTSADPIPGGKLIATAAKVGSKAAKKAKTVRQSTRTKNSCNSFEQGTLIVMADGSSTPIEDVVIGDEVLSSDGTVQSVQPVVELIRYHSERVWVDLTITTAEGVSPLVATDEHPFWVLEGIEAVAGAPLSSNTSCMWVNAVDLNVGDVLLTATGETALVSATDTRTATVWAYNFTVANTHTYYAGEQPVLNHNARVDGCGLPPLRNGRLSGNLPKNISAGATIAQLKAGLAKLQTSIHNRKNPRGHYGKLDEGHASRIARERRLAAQIESRLSR